MIKEILRRIVDANIIFSSLIVCLSPLVLFLFVHMQLPNSIPSHYNWQNQPDDYMHPTNYMLILICVNVALIALFSFVEYFMPKEIGLRRTFHLYRLIIHFVITVELFRMLIDFGI
jgi:uncharacterized membrane protein